MPPQDKPRKSSARPASRDTSPPPAAASPRVLSRRRKTEGEKGKRRDGTIPASSPPTVGSDPGENPKSKIQNPPLPSSTLVTAPRAVRDIPGLGPIRIRALEKAGLGSLPALRSATLEQLTAVPGVSEIKARHIQTFLAAAPIVTEEEQAREKSQPIWEPEESILDLPLWEREAEQSRADVIALLTSLPAPDFRARLLRELVRYASGMPVWQTALKQAGDKDQERALRRIRRLQEALSEALPPADVDRKTQSRLAEDLAEACDRLYALSGQPEPVRKAEDIHE